MWYPILLDATYIDVFPLSDWHSLWPEKQRPLATDVQAVWTDRANFAVRGSSLSSFGLTRAEVYR